MDGLPQYEERSSSTPLLELKPKPKDKLFFALIYTSFGMMYAFPWNSLINVLHILCVELYDDDSLADNLLVINEILALAVVIYFSFYNSVLPRIFQASTLIYGIDLLGILFIFLFVSKDSVFLRPLLYICITIFGTCLGVVCTIGFVFASMMPETYTGYVSLGSGIAGFVSFFFFFIADKTLWIRGSDNANSQILKTICFLFAFPIGLSIIIFIALFFLYNNLVFKDQMRKYYFRETSPEKSDDDLTIVNNNKDNVAYNVKTTEVPLEMKESRGIRAIWCDSWQQLITILVTSWLGLFLFPIIGPYMWDDSYVNDLQVGIYQFGDFFGRYMYNNFKFLRVPRSHIIYYGFFRLLFVVLFTMPIFIDIVNNKVFLILIMISFAFSNGAVVVQSMTYAPESVDRIKEKSKIGTFIPVGSQIMFTIGMSSAKGYKLAVEAIKNKFF